LFIFKDTYINIHNQDTVTVKTEAIHTCTLSYNNSLPFTLLNFVCRGLLTVSAASRAYVHLAGLLLGLRKSAEASNQNECDEIFHFVVFTSRIRINGISQLGFYFFKICHLAACKTTKTNAQTGYK